MTPLSKNHQNFFDQQRKKDALLMIKEYFKKERDEELGELGAELIYDFFIEKLAPSVYNQAIDDLKQWFKDRVFYLEADVDSLKKDTSYTEPDL